jgi:hypothetical protein
MSSAKTEVKEDDYFRVGDDVIVSQWDDGMSNQTRSWVVGSQAKLIGIHGNAYVLAFPESKPGLHCDINEIKLPDKKNRYQWVRRRNITKLELPKFRSVEKEAEYFRNEYVKIRGKSLSLVEEIRRKKDNEIDEIKSKLDNTVGIPANCINLQREGLIVTRLGEISYLTVMQKREITIDSFVCDRFNVKLPEELIYKGNVYLACNFTGGDKFAGLGVYTLKFKPFISFHTREDSGNLSAVCTGDLRVTPTLNANDIKKAFDEYQKVISVVNPNSYLNDEFSNSVSYEKKLKRIRDYVDDYRMKYYDEHKICRNCHRSGSECSCETCPNCEQDYDDCECAVCENCDQRVSGVCRYDLCDDCCANECHHCPNCGEGYEGYCEKCDRGISCGCCRGHE